MIKTIIKIIMFIPLLLITVLIAVFFSWCQWLSYVLFDTCSEDFYEELYDSDNFIIKYMVKFVNLFWDIYFKV